MTTILGVTGVIASFGMFYLGEQVLHLSRPTVQSLMYLKLSVAGQMTVFVARTRGPFWSVKPSRTLLLAVLGTQILATFIVVYGFLMAPLGWSLAGLVWGCAAVWFLISDAVKIARHRLLDPHRSSLAAARRTGTG